MLKKLKAFTHYPFIALSVHLSTCGKFVFIIDLQNLFELEEKIIFFKIILINRNLVDPWKI